MSAHPTMPPHVILSSRCIECWMSHRHGSLRCESCVHRPRPTTSPSEEQARRADRLMEAGRRFAHAMRSCYEGATLLRHGSEPRTLAAQAVEAARAAMADMAEACGVVGSVVDCAACMRADAGLDGDDDCDGGPS